MRSVVSTEIYTKSFVIQSREKTSKEAASARDDRESSRRVHLADLKDDEILFKSLHYAKNKSKSSMSGRLQDTVLSTSALMVPLAYGIMKKGSVVKNGAGEIVKNNILSSKVGSIVPAVLVFMGAGFLINGFKGLIDRAENASPKLARKRDSHPAVTAAVDTLLKAALLVGTASLFTKGKTALKNNFAPASEIFSKSVQVAANKMDNTKFAAYLANAGEKFSAFTGKHPILSKILENKNVQTFSPVLSWLGLNAALDYKVLKDRNKIAQRGAATLFQVREITKEA